MCTLKKKTEKEKNRKDIKGQRNIENVYKWRMKEAEEDGEEEEVRTRWRKRERLEGLRDDVEKRKAGKRSRSVKEDEEKRRRNDDGVGTEGRMKKERRDRG